MFSDHQPFADDVQRKRAIATMVRRQRRGRQACSAIIPVNSYQTQQIDLADMSLDEGRQAAHWQLGDRLDYPVDEAIIDIYRINPFGGEKRPYHYAVAARYTRLHTYVDELKASGLKLKALDLPEFALRNIGELFVDDSRGVAILLMLEQSGLLVVVRDGMLFLSRQLNTGVEHLLAAHDDERDAQFDTIVLDIQRSLDYCESTLHLPPVNRLLVATTGQELPALIDYLDRLLMVQAETLRLDEVMDIASDTDQLQLNQRLLAIGGALRREED